MPINPYIEFKGNCREAFTFYQQVLGGELVTMQTHGETPAAQFVPQDWHDKIMHAQLNVADASLMGSDASPEMQSDLGGFSVNYTVSDPSEAERLFQALAEGGQIKMPLEETFWATRFGMLDDKFGVPWMINCDAPLEQLSSA